MHQHIRDIVCLHVGQCVSLEYLLLRVYTDGVAHHVKSNRRRAEQTEVAQQAAIRFAESHRECAGERSSSEEASSSQQPQTVHREAANSQADSAGRSCSAVSAATVAERQH